MKEKRMSVNKKAEDTKRITSPSKRASILSSTASDSRLEQTIVMTQKF